VFVLGTAAVAPLVLRLALPNHRLEDPWRRRILDMCHDNGVNVRDVRVIEGRRQKMANAAFAGLWPGWRYLFVSDYLMDNFEDDELRAVIAHEIGHGKRHHIPIKIAAHFGGILLFAGLIILLASTNALERLDVSLWGP
jgi:STE24 endopeptidase